jgi:mRNA interferase MazF
MKGIPLSKSEGAAKDSVIKLNYVFTVSEEMISKVVFHLSKEKKRLLFEDLCKKLEGLKA